MFRQLNALTVVWSSIGKSAEFCHSLILREITLFEGHAFGSLGASSVANLGSCDWSLFCKFSKGVEVLVSNPDQHQQIKISKRRIRTFASSMDEGIFAFKLIGPEFYSRCLHKSPLDSFHSGHEYLVFRLKIVEPSLRNWWGYSFDFACPFLQVLFTHSWRYTTCATHFAVDCPSNFILAFSVSWDLGLWLLVVMDLSFASGI